MSIREKSTRRVLEGNLGNKCLENSSLQLLHVVPAYDLVYVSFIYEHERQE
jgi:hypothetical protein